MSALVFFGVPAVVISCIKPRYILRGTLFSLFSMPFMIIVDYIAELTGTWSWPLPHSILSFRVFNLVSLEVLMWAFLNFYVVAVFYECFFDSHRGTKLPHIKFKSAIIFTAVLFLAFLFAFLTYPELLEIPYWYAVFATTILVPPIIFQGVRFPKVLPKMLKTASYFIYLNLAYEITALKIGWWSFPSSQFLAKINLFGVAVPLEELVFWVILFTITLLSYYEYFLDDER